MNEPMNNPELEKAEQELRLQERQDQLEDTQDEDRHKIERAAFSGYVLPLEMVQALARECIRLRQEVAALRPRPEAGGDSPEQGSQP